MDVDVDVGSANALPKRTLRTVLAAEIGKGKIGKVINYLFIFVTILT